MGERNAAELWAKTGHSNLMRKAVTTSLLLPLVEVLA